MKLTPLSHLQFHGELDERLRRSAQHLHELNVPEMRMEFTHPTDFWHWGADYMGRWIAAMSLYGLYSGEDGQVRQVTHELIGFQKADGSFGPYTDPHDFQEWFGMSRGLVGLLEAYEADPDPAVLASARRLGDYYTDHYPACAECMYECYSTALEGLVLLAKLTSEPRYLEAARRMAEASVVYQGIRYSAEVAENGRRTPCAGQVHCQLSTARGLLDLYELTGEARYLHPVLHLHEDIQNDLLWISGGIGFYHFRPEENETCADADWLRLNLQLWRLTGEARFMHLAERILLNQIYFNQTDNGGFCYLRGLQNRAGAVFDACCSHHGPRALLETLRYVYTTGESAVWINLFQPGRARLVVDDAPVHVESSVEVQKDRLAYALTIRETPGTTFSIHIRLPEWASRVELAVNQATEPLENKHSGYQTITRSWKPGDRLEVSFDFALTVHLGESLGRHILNPGAAAVSYGPQVFCLNDFWNPAVRVHLAQMALPQDNPTTALHVLSADRLEVPGTVPENPHITLVLTPLAGVGGVPSGAGRIHTIRSPYYKVWIPMKSQG